MEKWSNAILVLMLPEPILWLYFLGHSIFIKLVLKSMIILIDSDEDDDDSDDDDDDTEALMAELERIKKERAEEKLRKVNFTLLHCCVAVIMVPLHAESWIILFSLLMNAGKARAGRRIEGKGSWANAWQPSYKR
jgi:Cwf15/Cwc15 cell cycle control protein